TKHCQRSWPGPGVMNEKVTTLWAYFVVHGATLQVFLALEGTPTRGTLTPSAGTVKVCPTPAPTLEFTSDTRLPFRTMEFPIVPRTRPRTWLRNGLPLSYW